MSKFDRKEEKARRIKQFKEDFQLEFGSEILIIERATKYPFPHITLQNVEDVVNYQLDKIIPDKFSNGIRTKSRNKELISHRYCFYKIVMDMGYSCTVIKKHIGFDHATVLHGKKSITNLILSRDTKSIFNINNIYHELKERFGIDADIQSDGSTGTDS